MLIKIYKFVAPVSFQLIKDMFKLLTSSLSVKIKLVPGLFKHSRHVCSNQKYNYATLYLLGTTTGIFIGWITTNTYKVVLDNVLVNSFLQS